MTKPEIHYFNNPGEYFAKNAEAMARIGCNAFGRSIEDFGASIQSKFERSAFGQAIIDNEQPVGFALYRDLGTTLWLRGVAIAKSHQGQGLGAELVKASAQGFEGVVATTRNPATIKLIGSVTRLTCPDLRLENPLQNVDNLHLQALFSTYSQAIDASSATIPYVLGTYPPDLYDIDPGVALPFPEIAQHPENAIMVVGMV